MSEATDLLSTGVGLYHHVDGHIVLIIFELFFLLHARTFSLFLLKASTKDATLCTSIMMLQIWGIIERKIRQVTAKRGIIEKKSQSRSSPPHQSRVLVQLRRGSHAKQTTYHEDDCES